MSKKDDKGTAKSASSPYAAANRGRVAKARELQIQASANAAEATSNAAALLQEMFDATAELCVRLLEALEPCSRPKDPVMRTINKPAQPSRGSFDEYDRYQSPSGGVAGRPAPPARDLDIRLDGVKEIVTKYPELGFKRMRCYFRQAPASTTVRVYDVIVPTWNNTMLMDPAASYAGPEKLWLGFRPATAPKDGGRSDITVMSVSDLPVIDKDDVEDTAGEKVWRAENYYYKVHDPEWQDHHDISLDPNGLTACKAFITQAQDLVDEIFAASNGIDAKELTDLLEIAKGTRRVRELGEAEPAADAPEAPQADPAPGAKAGPSGPSPTPRRSGPQGPGDVDKVL